MHRHRTFRCPRIQQRCNGLQAGREAFREVMTSAKCLTFSTNPGKAYFNARSTLLDTPKDTARLNRQGLKHSVISSENDDVLPAKPIKAVNLCPEAIKGETSRPYRGTYITEETSTINTACLCVCRNWLRLARLERIEYLQVGGSNNEIGGARWRPRDVVKFSGARHSGLRDVRAAALHQVPERCPSDDRND